MKKILMAAVAVSALTAGSASALELSISATAQALNVGGSGANTLGGSLVGTKYLNPTGGTTAEAFTIASETQVTNGTIVPATLRVSTSAAGLAANSSYVVTYTITGGTFVTAGVVPTDAKALGAVNADNGTVTTVGEVTPTKVQFLFNTAAAAVTTGLNWVTKGIIPDASKGPIAVSVSVSPQSNTSLFVDGGATTPTTIIDFRTGYAFKANTVATAPTLSIASSFKKFGAGAVDATSTVISSNIGFVANGPVVAAQTNDVIYKYDGSALAAATDFTAATLTVGGSLAAFDAKIGSSTTAQVADATTGVIPVLNPTNLALLTSQTVSVTLAQKATPVAGTEATYTIKPTDVVMAAGLLPSTYTAKTMGTVSFEGVNFYGAWLTDGAGTSGFKNSIRLGNKSTAAIASVKASLINPLVTGTSGTVASTTTCEVGPLPASGELLVTSAVLYKCFGAFGRSDVRLTIQGNKSDLSAKMRLTSPDGSAADTVLGSGTADASDNYVN